MEEDPLLKRDYHQCQTNFKHEMRATSEKDDALNKSKTYKQMISNHLCC